MWGFSRWIVTKATVYLTHWGGALPLSQQKGCRWHMIRSMAAHVVGCHINVLGCSFCLYLSHLLWLVVQAKAEVFHHRLESSADAIASMQFGQGGLMEMPFKKAGVAYGKAREVSKLSTLGPLVQGCHRHLLGPKLGFPCCCSTWSRFSRKGAGAPMATLAMWS